MNDKTRMTRAVVAAALGAVGLRALSARRRADPAHAPGHRHRQPPEDVPMPSSGAPDDGHDQPWVRTSHSDSQQRRFRR